MDKQQPTEHAEQVAVASWLRRHGVWFFAVPNGAKMGAREAAKMKKEGLEPGVPDLIILDSGKKLAIEMKARNGKGASKNQRRWLAHLETQGFDVIVCHGAEKAIAWLQNRLGLQTRAP